MTLVPLYRLRNNAEHFYTIDEVERDSAISQYGYSSEGIACWVFDSDQPVSLRDQFALAALAVVNTAWNVADISDHAYKIADEMILRRMR